MPSRYAAYIWPAARSRAWQAADDASRADEHAFSRYTCAVARREVPRFACVASLLRWYARATRRLTAGSYSRRRRGWPPHGSYAGKGSHTSVLKQMNDAAVILRILMPSLQHVGGCRELLIDRTREDSRVRYSFTRRLRLKRYFALAICLSSKLRLR